MTTATQPDDSTALRARMADLFASACSKLGLRPLSTYFGHHSHACFGTEWEAGELAKVLCMTSAKDVSVYHWDPKVDPDFTRDEWQVSWS